MAAVKYKFSIGALKAFYSIFCADILLVYISRNAVSENRKNCPPKFHRSAPLRLRQAANLRRFLCNQIEIINPDIFPPRDLPKGSKTLCTTTTKLSLTGNSSGPRSLNVELTLAAKPLSAYIAVQL